MNPADKSRAGARKTDTGTDEGDAKDAKDKKTPAPDMQADDAGTAASGNDEGTAAQSVMKQQQKTGDERGDERGGKR